MQPLQLQEGEVHLGSQFQSMISWLRGKNVMVEGHGNAAQPLVARKQRKQKSQG